MSTRSTIAYQYQDGKIVSVYCHWDGYPSNNGRILLRHYKDAKKVSRLVKQAISGLGPSPKSTRYMSDGHGKDWEYVKPHFFKNFDEYVKSQSSTFEEWAYLYTSDGWKVMDCHRELSWRHFVPLTKKYIKAYVAVEKARVRLYSVERNFDKLND